MAQRTLIHLSQGPQNEKKISAAANYSRADEREADRKRRKSLLPAAWEEVEVGDLFPHTPIGDVKAISWLCCRAAAGGTNETAAEEKEAPAAATWVLVPASLAGPNLNSCDCRGFTSLAAVAGVLVASEVRRVSLLAATTVSKTVLMLR